VVAVAACNRTYYGDVGKTYELELHRPREDRMPFVCHLTFQAAGGDMGDIVQVCSSLSCTPVDVFIPSMMALMLNLSLSLIKHHTMKTYGSSGDVSLHAFLDSALDGGELSASRPGSFTSAERAAGVFRTGWAPEPVWTLWRKNICHYQKWNPDSSAIQAVNMFSRAVST
jgi:hypothetical protein